MYVYKYVHLRVGYPRRLETGVRDPGGRSYRQLWATQYNAGKWTLAFKQQVLLNPEQSS